MPNKLLTTLYRRVPRLESWYHRWRFYLERRQQLRQMKRDRYHLKELAVDDPDDPRVWLSHQTAIFSTHPMQMDRATADHLRKIFERDNAEIQDMEAQFAAGVERPQPRPEEVERILRERNQRVV